jgi:hypothetical protein
MTRPAMALLLALLALFATPRPADPVIPATDRSGLAPSFEETVSGKLDRLAGAPLAASLVGGAPQSQKGGDYLDNGPVRDSGVINTLPAATLTEPRGGYGGQPVKSEPATGLGSVLVGGYATWFDPSCQHCAAAGPELRRALGPDWRGTLIDVGGPGGASVSVVLSDFCACGERNGLPTLLDLSADAFAELAPLEWGVVAVSIEIAVELPRTDADLRMMLEVRGDELYQEDHR